MKMVRSVFEVINQTVLRMCLWIVLMVAWQCSAVAAVGRPLLGPDVMSFGSLPPLTLWHTAPIPMLPSIPLQQGLPAPKGAEFDGPDPGLNAAIITVPKESCPSGYRRDFKQRCRLQFGYGPNPFYSFTPENFKGDIQFYMGLEVGATQIAGRRRGRARGRPRAPLLEIPRLSQQSIDDDDD